MASVTFPVELGGDGNTYTDDTDPQTGLANNGHLTRFIPTLQGAVAMASTAKDKASEAATSATNAAASASAASTSESNAGTSATNAANSASAASDSETAAAISESNASASETASANSASTANTAESGAVAAAAAAEADADRAEEAAQGLLGKRTVVSTGAEAIVVSDQDSGTHYRGTRNSRQEYQLDPDAAEGMTIHVQARGTALIAFVGGLIRSRGGRRYITEQDGQVTATKTAQTEWSLAGDLGDVQTELSDYQLADASAYQLSDGSTYQVTTVTAAV